MMGTKDARNMWSLMTKLILDI